MSKVTEISFVFLISEPFEKLGIFPAKQRWTLPEVQLCTTDCNLPLGFVSVCFKCLDRALKIMSCRRKIPYLPVESRKHLKVSENNKQDVKKCHGNLIKTSLFIISRRT